VSTPETQLESQRWLGFARQDVADAESLLRGNEGRFRNVGFLAQQCVEKSLKTVLVWEGQEVPFRHDLAFLRTLIPAAWQVPEVDWPWLTYWATAGRYPGDVPEPTLNAARMAVEQARAVLEAVVAEIGRREAPPI